MTSKTNTSRLVVSALMIAIASVLSLLKLFELPFGGTVTVASMVPVVLLGYIYGTRWGLFSAFIYSALQLVLGVGTGIVSKMFLPGDEQMALWQALTICGLDYILANGVLGLGGIFRGKLKNAGVEVSLGAIVATFMKLIMHTISGFIFYGAWAEWFFSGEGGLAEISFLSGFCAWVMENMQGKMLSLFYSIVYNSAYMLPELVITAIVAPVIYKAIKKTKLI